jgi:hypothetical protein
VSPKYILFTTVLLSAFLLSACARGIGEGELAELDETVEAMPAEQAAALEDEAIAVSAASQNNAQRSVAQATQAAARATATAVGQAVASGERVNATAVPDAAPVIVYFFASVPNQAQAADGIRYFLNYTTERANRVEIFGNVMENPQQGSWPVYNPSNNWVLWAANDIAWVESSLQVQPDQDTGSKLQNVTVSGSGNVTLSLRDSQLVDGDVINVDVNGVRVVSQYVLGGRYVTFPVTLQSGANDIVLSAQSAGVTPPLVAEVSVSNVTSGPAVQQTRGLNASESQSFTITAP